MKRIIKIAMLATGLAVACLLANGIGWAAVFYWKAATIATIAGAVAIALCPMAAIEVVPGSSLDTPYFFLPAIVLNFFLWAIFIETMWNRKKTRKT